MPPKKSLSAAAQRKQKKKAPAAPVVVSKEEEDADDEDEEEEEDEEDDEDEDEELAAEEKRRDWSQMAARERSIKEDEASGVMELAKRLGVDDLSSDDEEPGNTIGRVPLHWYEGYDHIGYDVAGEKVIAQKQRSLLDAALAGEDDDGGWTVYDKLNGREIKLSARDIETVKRIQAGAFGNKETEMYPDYVDYVTWDKEIMPIYKNQYEPKRRFLPSKWEAMRVKKIVNGLKAGRLMTRAEVKAKRDQERDPEVIFRKFAESLWAEEEDDDEETTRHKGPMHIAAPRQTPPGHAESYNPPEEYLKDEDDKDDDGFVPKKHDSLRQVAAYEGFVKERFDRCLDLYLCPRAFKRRLNIDPETLVPQLPKPAELKPFPNAMCREYPLTGSPSATPVAVSCSTDGQWLAVADDEACVRIFEVSSSRCISKCTLSTGGEINDMRWNPSSSLHVLAIAASDGLHFLDCGTARSDDTALTTALLAPSDSTSEEPTIAQWAASTCSSSEGDWGSCLSAKLDSAAMVVAWHHGGDYAVSVAPAASSSRQVVVHRVSRRESQAPLKRAGGSGDAAQTACFHPTKPFLFVATRTAVRVFHLLQQKLVKTLSSGCKWISTMDVHPSGDHLIVGSCDRRLCWFDMDLGTKPYKTLKYHDKALRSVKFHKRYPLMASAADDGNIHVFHSMVYSDLMRSPLIVPVKKHSAAHQPNEKNLGALSMDFHPTQPWLFSCGGDKTVKLFHAI